jgi:cytokinin dehydrogenase
MRSASRRDFVKGLLTGASALVIGFDPVERTWITEAHAKHDKIKVPDFDGQLITDAAGVAEYSEDFGKLVQKTPRAVLLPASVDDVVKAVKFCRKYGISIVGRGEGHSSGGQSLAENGLVIDMSVMNQIVSISATSATVEAGVTLKEILAASIPLGARPPVVTGYVGLTVGGVLSMGGVGPQSYRFGAIVDNVIELEVVTGTGDLKKCSLTKNPLLFQAVVGGVGQFGIIVRAKIKMMSALPAARNYLIVYFDLPTLFTDANILMSGRVDALYMRILPDGAGGWLYAINCAKYYTPGAEPDDSVVLAGLHFPPPALTVNDVPAFVFDAFADDIVFTQLDAAGLFRQIPHVWGDVFLPVSKIQSFIQQTLPTLTPADLGPDGGFILLYPLKNLPSALAFRLPQESQVYLFDILTSIGASADIPGRLAKARGVYEAARAQGGTLYPIGSTPMSRQDWIRHYGPLYPALVLAKALFDPDRILTPGVDIF